VPNLLADTGVWYALYDERDQHHAETLEKIYLLELHNVVLPWPVFYETLRTRMVRNPRALQMFENPLRTITWTELDDSTYRQQALALCFESTLRRARPLSMVDRTLRLALEDINVKIDFFMTFNFADFHDICQHRQVEMV
jgi:predicted nucleic acid-binding protein